MVLFNLYLYIPLVIRLTLQRRLLCQHHLHWQLQLVWLTLHAWCHYKIEVPVYFLLFICLREDK